MELVKNKYGIKMFYQKAQDIEKINILDSNGNYFNDLDIDTYQENDNELIIKMLEETTLEQMSNFFGARTYLSLKELILKENLTGITTEELLKNPYLNIFIVNNLVYYTFID